jgi:hypothetical protein
MALVKMMAIEYNMWMSIISLINKTIKSSAIDYDGFGRITNIPILPAYPRNLTNFTKPSIIVQKVDTNNAPICFGGFIGKYHDIGNNTDLDVFGVNYESTYQIDVCGDSNTQRSLIMATLIDELFNNIRFCNNGQVEIYNYALSLNNPQLMGYAKLDQDIDVQNLDKKYRSDNEYKLYNNDYTTAIRFDISMLQVIVPDNQKLIDLTKPIKITQRVKL